MIRCDLLVLALLLGAVPVLEATAPTPTNTEMDTTIESRELTTKQDGSADYSPSLVTYNGQTGETYDDSNYVKASKHIYAVDEEDLTVAAHPSYAIQSLNGSLLLSGDSFGDQDGRGWANYFDEAAKLKWAWHSGHHYFDAILGAAVLPDETVILGGTRSMHYPSSTNMASSKRQWQLFLVAILPNGTKAWHTTLTPKPPKSTCKNCWSVIYWMDIDPKKELLIIGGVVDHQPGADTIAWKSGGGQPDVGGVPFLAAIPFSKLASAPTNGDIETALYFDNEPGYTTVVSLRAEHGKGVVALLPLNPFGGAVARVKYDESGKFQKEWIKPLSVKNQVTDIAIVGDNAAATAYVVSATVNPGGEIEALAPDGSSDWVRRYDINSTFPPARTSKGQHNWCQECWSIASHDDKIMLSCGVAELAAGDMNCDHGRWRSLLVTFSFQQPTNASYDLFHSNPDENFSVEYASFGAKGEVVCAIDADAGSSVVRIRQDGHK